METESPETTGRRNTWQREAILSVLNAMSGPISAEDIHGGLRQKGKKLNLSTIYRYLQALERNNVVHRLVPGNGKKALYALHGTECNTHLLICRKCGSKRLTRWCPLKSMEGMPDDSFLIECHHLELRGLCKQCREK